MIKLALLAYVAVATMLFALAGTGLLIAGVIDSIA
jgi:hypothetical protein